VPDDSISLSMVIYNEIHKFSIYISYVVGYEARGSVMVKALCYKPEGRGFDSR
jgi:hypothetical protein